MATFADLMSLLMCFFVLLLSFATIDAVRFKKMAESMKDAFGVQREIPAPEIVKGVSVIKQEWSPSISEPSVITEIRQETSDVERQFVDINDSTDAADAADQLSEEQVMETAQEIIERELEAQKEELVEALQGEIDQGMVTIEREATKIIIRINEKGSFASGSASLAPGFADVADRISAVLASSSGDIVVAGHTDNIPISTGRFRSNWELSAARAVTVLHELLRNPALDAERIQVQGYADTKPLAPNDTPQERAQNRRVELILIRGEQDEELDPAALEDLAPFLDIR